MEVRCLPGPPLEMLLRLPKTRPFRDYQAKIGSATYLINTIAVGLELVAEGGDKPSPLHIKWQKPTDPRNIASQARAFALLAVINLAVDAVDCYLREMGRLTWLPADGEVRAILTKAATREGGRAYSLPDRARSLLSSLQRSEPILVAMLDVMASWRNMVVHSGADRTIAAAEEEVLSAAAAYLSETYARLDIRKLLDNFRERKNPSLKEATSLVAATHNLVRALDDAVISATASSSEGLLKVAKAILAENLMRTPEEGAALKQVWRMDPETRERKLTGILKRNGLGDGSSGPSAVLDPNFVPTLARMPLAQVSDHLAP